MSGLDDSVTSEDMVTGFSRTSDVNVGVVEVGDAIVLALARPRQNVKWRASTGGFRVSVVDVSFTSSALARLVRGWPVFDDVETLSDHLYILYKISTHPAAQPPPSPISREYGPRWQLGRGGHDSGILASPELGVYR